MTIFDYISSAFRTLSNNKLRTFLTTLGIVIGISSVIVISMLSGSLGETISDYLSALFKSNYVYFELQLKKGCVYDGDDLYWYLYEQEEKFFNDENLSAYESMFDGSISKAIVHQDYIVGTVADSSEDNYVLLQGISPAADGLIGGTIKYGRFLNDEDMKSAAPVCIVTTDMVKKRFGENVNMNNIIGEQIDIVSDSERYPGCSLTIVGIFEVSPLFGYGYIDGHPVSLTVTSYTQMEKLTGNLIDGKGIPQYKVIDMPDREYFEKFTKEYFDKKLQGTDFEIKITFFEDIINQFTSIVTLVTSIILVIAAVSLFVGGVGVMNVMIVSVTERTMEIGTRKALGATNKSIYIQFITESVIIVMLGAIIGILLGLFFSKCIALLLVFIAKQFKFAVNIVFKLPTKMIIFAVLFSFAVGIIFGLYPAQKASKMQIVDALRYE